MESVQFFTSATKCKGSYADRRVVYSFDGPVTETPENSTGVWNRRVKIDFAHNKTMKRYEATVWSVAATVNASGFSVEQFALFSGTSAVIATEPTERFSKNSFVQFISRAMDLIIDISNDESNGNLAATLIREARSFAGAAV